jgi:hypothetical protein
MALFLRKIFLILIVPVIFLMGLEIVLPVTLFTHRHFEAISFSTLVPHNSGSFPNIRSKMNAVGDLCHHSKFAVIKKEVWNTDKLGFRNNDFIADPDVLIIGDSFIMGSGLSQDETITNQVQSKIGNKVKIYNLATCTFFDFKNYYAVNIFKKPKVLIFSNCERVVPEKLNSIKKRSVLKSALTYYFEIGNLNEYIDRALRFFSIKWVKARINNATGNGIPAVDNSNMFFLNGIHSNHNKGDLYATSTAVISYKKYCDSLGIDFLYLPMPNKESVYFERVPFAKQPEYLFLLDSILQTAHVATINSLNIYNEYRKTSNELLYHLDDTHWNPKAVTLISNQILLYLKNRTVLKQIGQI